MCATLRYYYRRLPLLTPLLLLWAAVALLFTAAAENEEELFARDGLGRPVAWWAVLKLPMHVRADVDGTNKKNHVRPTPCDCAAPDCANAPTAGLNVSARASGLCYLYADANNPTFQHFRALGYDCLGQGGNDPVSHTLRQLRSPPSQQRRGGGEHQEQQEPYWAIFNDQLNGIARDYQPKASQLNASRSGELCSGGNLFSAHAKGAVGFRVDTGGFFLQTSTPNFPDPTPTTASSSKDDNDHREANNNDETPFVRLGCQVDNNLQFAQHLFAMSLDMTQLELLGTQLQVARLCSGNFYSIELSKLLASERLYADGSNASVNGNFSGLYDALLNAKLPEREHSAVLNLTLKRIPTQQSKRSHVGGQRSSVYVETSSAQSLDELNSQLQHEDMVRQPQRVQYGPQVQPHDDQPDEIVHVLVKSPKVAVPPWAIVAESLETDISVASWWDGSYGIPTVCAGDDFSLTRNQFCMEDAAHDVHFITANGTARFNIENLIEATWRMGNDTLTWHLIGGREPDGNHAKWALTSPRDGVVDAERAFVTFADLNMEGFPCSTACNGSQAGRGGTFFSLQHAALHASLAKRIVSKACLCSAGAASRGIGNKRSSSSSADTNASGRQEERGADHRRDGAEATSSSFTEARMCHFGCWRKVEARFSPEELPRLAPNASSFWPE